MNGSKSDREGDDFRVSSFCQTAGCVEVAPLPGGGAILRDSKDITKQSYYFDAEGWRAFIAQIKAL
jgi:hypothetical protein